MGDFNLNIQWTNDEPIIVGDATAESFKELSDEMALSQLIKDPTRTVTATEKKIR
jgi:hypothetical protein